MSVEELIKQAKSYLMAILEDCFEDCLDLGKTAYNAAKADAYLGFVLKELEQREAED